MTYASCSCRVEWNGVVVDEDVDVVAVFVVFLCLFVGKGMGTPDKRSQEHAGSQKKRWNWDVYDVSRCFMLKWFALTRIQLDAMRSPGLPSSFGFWESDGGSLSSGAEYLWFTSCCVSVYDVYIYIYIAIAELMSTC